MIKTNKEVKDFLLLWSTQALSQLGSSTTSFALSIWLYEKTGSALQSATLMICSYTPYVLISIFAGALSDKWSKKKTMLVCDTLAAICTLTTLILLIKNLLAPWHLYLMNVINGLMNTFQGPASETAMSILTPKEWLQKASGLKSLSRSLVTIFNPILATSLYSIFGMPIVCLLDLSTFILAFVVLALFVEIKEDKQNTEKENIWILIKEGKDYLKDHSLILNIILFLSGINFVASSFDTILIPLVLAKTNNNEKILGIVSSFSGIAMLLGSFIAVKMKEPKNKARTLYLALLFSMSLENFLMAFSSSWVVWCLAQISGWITIPIFNACYDLIFKTTIPIEMQGRVYSFRNSLQFFTIPLGYFAGGFLVDKVFEPLLLPLSSTNLIVRIFGTQKGGAAALSMFVTGVLGVLDCLIFRNKLDDTQKL